MSRTVVRVNHCIFNKFVQVLCTAVTMWDQNYPRIFFAILSELLSGMFSWNGQQRRTCLGYPSWSPFCLSKIMLWHPRRSVTRTALIFMALHWIGWARNYQWIGVQWVLRLGVKAQRLTLESCKIPESGSGTFEHCRRKMEIMGRAGRGVNCRDSRDLERRWSLACLRQGGRRPSGEHLPAV